MAGAEDLGELIAHWFEAQLRRGFASGTALQAALKEQPLLQNGISRIQNCGERLLTVCTVTGRAKDGQDSTGLAQEGGGGVGLSLQNFEEYLHQSLPPCMRHLVLHQRSVRHLKFQGRMQLRPFLRKAGLDLASALRW